MKKIILILIATFSLSFYAKATYTITVQPVIANMSSGCNAGNAYQIGSSYTFCVNIYCPNMTTMTYCHDYSIIYTPSLSDTPTATKIKVDMSLLDVAKPIQAQIDAFNKAKINSVYIIERDFTMVLPDKNVLFVKAGSYEVFNSTVVALLSARQ